MNRLIGLLCGWWLLASCTSETYDTGDGPYSYMRADFVEAHTSAAEEMDRVVTDDDVELVLSPHIGAKWASKADTFYRALFYYDYQEGMRQVRPRSVAQVMVLRPIRTSRPDTLRHDPMVFESAWMSKNKKYLNIRFAVMTGQDAEGQIRKQDIGLQCDTVWQDGRVKALRFRLIHDQCGVPEYYSSHGYLSVPLDDTARGADLSLRLTTYRGEVTRDF